MQCYLQTEVGVEVEDELGKIQWLHDSFKFYNQTLVKYTPSKT